LHDPLTDRRTHSASRYCRGRKTGFACPRGCGAKTCYDRPCPGRILKSHPIHVVNEEGKKRRKAAAVAHAGDQAPKFGPAAKAAKAAAAEQAKREKELKMAKDAEKRRREEERMAAAARARQADKDASKREHKAAEEARKLAEARELAAAAKRELQLARGGSGDLRRSSLDKPARGPKPGPTRGTDPSWDARDAFAPPPRSATISLSDLFGEVDVNSDNGGGGSSVNGSERDGGDDWPSTGDASSAWGPRQQQQQQQQQHQQQPRAFPPLNAGGSSDRPPRPPRSSPEQQAQIPGRPGPHHHHPSAPSSSYPSAPSSSYGMTRTPSNVTMASSQGDANEHNAGGMSTAGVFPPGVERAAASPILGDVGPVTHQRRACVRAMLRRAAKEHVERLRDMGFDEWRCRLAVMRFGDDADGASMWLINHGEGDSVDGQTEEDARDAQLEGASNLDIDRDLANLREVYHLGFDVHSVDEAVATCKGDLHLAVASLFQQQTFGVSGVGFSPGASHQHQHRTHATQSANAPTYGGNGRKYHHDAGPATPPERVPGSRHSSWGGDLSESGTGSDADLDPFAAAAAAGGGGSLFGGGGSGRSESRFFNTASAAGDDGGKAASGEASGSFGAGAAGLFGGGSLFGGGGLFGDLAGNGGGGGGGETWNGIAAANGNGEANGWR